MKGFPHLGGDEEEVAGNVGNDDGPGKTLYKLRRELQFEDPQWGSSLKNEEAADGKRRVRTQNGNTSKKPLTDGGRETQKWRLL